MKYHYACVNEDGEEYENFDELQPALEMLEEFPNDMVVITIAGHIIEENT